LYTNTLVSFLVLSINLVSGGSESIKSLCRRGVLNHRLIGQIFDYMK
jgi:hypothetical protein